MHRLLIVEDDEVIAKYVANHLAKWDYEVKCIVDFKEVMTTFCTFNPQLVLLDISLPFRNGYHWCSEIRKLSNVPIVFLSSASDNMNMVMAMNMGADDFIAKPFDLNVLTAKVGALLRRAYSFGGESNLLVYNGAVLHIGEGVLRYEDRQLSLTKNELKLLQLLFENRGQVVSRDDMMLKLWNSDSFIDDNTLTVNMTRLRKKLEDMGMPDWIQTKKGLGYKLV